MTDEAVSPLRRRMIEDMTIRKFAPKTQHDYLQRVKNRGGPACLNRFSASISGASAVVTLPSGRAAG